jgi:hypothetical protein
MNTINIDQFESFIQSMNDVMQLLIDLNFNKYDKLYGDKYNFEIDVIETKFNLINFPMSLKDVFKILSEEDIENTIFEDNFENTELKIKIGAGIYIDDDKYYLDQISSSHKINISGHDKICNEYKIIDLFNGFKKLNLPTSDLINEDVLDYENDFIKFCAMQLKYILSTVVFELNMLLYNFNDEMLKDSSILKGATYPKFVKDYYTHGGMREFILNKNLKKLKI